MFFFSKCVADLLECVEFEKLEQETVDISKVVLTLSEWQNSCFS